MAVDQPNLTWQLPADTEVTGIAVADGGASTLLLAARSDGRLALFDVDPGQMTRAPLDCHATRFTVAGELRAGQRPNTVRDQRLARATWCSRLEHLR